MADLVNDAEGGHGVFSNCLVVNVLGGTYVPALCFKRWGGHKTFAYMPDLQRIIKPWCARHGESESTEKEGWNQ